MSTTATLVALDAAWIVFAGGAPRAGGTDAFQQSTCGFGVGASVSPSWCFFTLDPRVERVCENELWPIPGLPCPNPSHGAVIVDLPPLNTAF
ncbi:MAG: hypothetical protein HOP29_16915 [Phycisphaerales bacterium]|nr:hypothetical protein [Phycisphaerales bacterium]